MLSQKQILDFQELIWDYYRHHRRDLAWRETTDPYAIYVSEVMLQQTQVDRVKPKYESFLERFPDFGSLAAAHLSEVITEWSGLGYNRRAKFLKQAAEIILRQHKGKVPNTPKDLIALPGIGAGTVGSLLAFVHEQPFAFIETNIRRVYIHHFFDTAGVTLSGVEGSSVGVHDKDILPIVAQTLDRANPREWYYALMDYGSHLAKQVVNPNRHSKHYSRQSKFEGSLRQGRGIVLRELATGAKKQKSLTRLLAQSGFLDEHITRIYSDLIREGFIVQQRNSYRLA